MFISKKEKAQINQDLRNIKESLTIYVPLQSMCGSRAENTIFYLLARVAALEKFLNVRYQEPETNYTEAKYVSKGKKAL